MNGFLIDVPQIAYMTWNIMVIDRKTGAQMVDAENRLKNNLRKYEYSKKNEHVR